MVALRSRLLQAVSGSGGMAVTELAVEAVEERLKAPEWSGLSLAVVNTPSSTVVSGPSEAVERWVQRLGEEGVFCRRVNVDYASHSAEVDPILAELESVLSELAPQAGQVPMVSTVTGARCEGTTLDGAYWCRNLRQTVRLDRALRGADGWWAWGVCRSERAPGAGDAAVGGERRVRRRGGRFAASRGGRDVGAAAQSRRVARPWCCGRVGEGAGGAGGPRMVALPTYAFQRQRYWLEAEKASGDVSTMGLSSAEHPLLGAATPLADSERFLLTGRLSVAEPGWLERPCGVRDGAAAGDGAVGAGFCGGARGGLDDGVAADVGGAAGAAGRRGGSGSGSGGCAGGGRGRAARAEHLQPIGRCCRGTAWTLHAQGVLSLAQEAAAEESGLEAWPPVGGTPIDLTGLYSTLQAHGYGYGPSFQGLREAWRVGDVVYGRVVLPEALSASADDYGLHPALLDAALHVLGLADAGVAGGEGLVLLPFEWSEVTLVATGARELRVRASVERRGDGEAWALLQLGRWQRASGGAGWRAAAEGSERSADPRGGAQRGAAPVPAGVASGGVERGRAGSACHRLIVGGDGELAGRLGLDHVDSVAALVARLDEGEARPRRRWCSTMWRSRRGEALLAATHAGAERGLSELQAILSEARLNETAVAWLTSGAVATGPEEGVAGLSRAPLWGLVRSARAEHPDRRLQLVDVDAPALGGGIAGEAVVDGGGAGAGAAAWRGGGAAAGACGVGSGCASGAGGSGGLPRCGHSIPVGSTA